MKQASLNYGSCECCGELTYLEKHHVSYSDYWWENEVLMMVCRECHERIHFEDGFKDGLNPLKKNVGDEGGERDTKSVVREKAGNRIKQEGSSWVVRKYGSEKYAP